MKRPLMIVVALLLSVSVAAVTLVSVSKRSSAERDLPPDLIQWNSSISKECAAGDRFACMSVKPVQMAMSGDIVGAAKLVSTLGDESDLFRSRCHEVSHLIGRIAEVKIGVLEVAKRVGGGCGGGLLHGAEEQWGYSRTLAEIEAGAAEMCELLRMTNETAVDGCVHAIGHALYDSIKDPFVGAAKCPEIFENENLLSACAEGSVMAYVDQIPGPLTEEQLRSDYQSCPKLDKGYSSELCAGALGRALVRSLDKDVARSLQFCIDNAGALTDFCVIGVGHEAAYQKNPKPEEMAPQCLSFGGKYLDACLAGGAKLIGIDFLRPEVSEQICKLNPAGIGPRCNEVLDIVWRNSKGLRELEKR